MWHAAIYPMHALASGHPPLSPTLSLAAPSTEFTVQSDWNEDKLSQIATEVETMRSIEHPNVLTCLGSQHDQEKQVIYIFLEYMPLGSIQVPLPHEPDPHPSDTLAHRHAFNGRTMARVSRWRRRGAIRRTSSWR